MKTRFFTGVAALVAITVVLEVSEVQTAFAQPPGRTDNGGGRGAGGRQGGGGQRGFGGGGMMRGGDPVMGLLRSPEVREELKIDAEQEAAITKIERQVRDQPRGEGDADTRNFDFRNASEEERQKFFAKMQAAQKEQAAKSRELLEEVLMPTQLQRLDQLALQQRGVMALGDAEVQKELGMTSQQVAKLDQVRSEQESAMRDKMQELMQSGDRDSMREKMTEFRDEVEESVTDVLTAEQKAKFKEMKGTEFDFGVRGGRGGDRGGVGGGRGGDAAGGRGGAGGGRGGRGGAGGGRGGAGGGRGNASDN